MASSATLRSAAVSAQAVVPVRRVALVTRVSSERQAANDEGSLVTQLQRLRAHIDYKRNCGEQWQEVAVYELRAVSGKHSLRSPDLLHLQQDIVSGRVNTVLCTALDRISRSVKDFLTFFEFLADHGVEFVCLKQNYDTTTPHGRLFVTMMVALAQFEREQTSERTRDAMAARAERGLWNGGRLFGYDLDHERKGYLLVNEQEAAVVRFAFEKYLECGSIAGTVNALNAAGFRTKAYTSRSGVAHSGGPFYISLVQELLQNPAYVGLKEVGKRQRQRSGGVHREKHLVSAVWPALIDQETFDAVQALMRANGQTRTNQAKEMRHAYVLNSGLLFCGACGSLMEGRSGTGRLGKRHYYYACKGKTCGMRVVAEEIEGAIVERLGVLAGDLDLLDQIVTTTNKRLHRQLPVLGKRRRAIARDLADVKGQVSSLLENLGDLGGAGARKLVAAQLDSLAERQEQIEASLRDVDEAISQLQAASIDTRGVQEALAQIRRIYDHLQPIERKELFRLLVHRAEVHARKIVLELHTKALNSVAEGSTQGTFGDKTLWVTNPAPRVGVSERFYDEFPVHLPSLLTRCQRSAEARRARGRTAVAAEWQELLHSGKIASRARLARAKGVSRARVTQVLSPALRSEAGQEQAAQSTDKELARIN